MFSQFRNAVPSSAKMLKFTFTFLLQGLVQENELRTAPKEMC